MNNIKVTKEYVRKNIFIGLEKENQKDSYIKESTEYKGIQKYMYLDINENNDDSEELSFIRVNKCFLEIVNISEAEAWHYAEKNMFYESKIVEMKDLFPWMIHSENEAFLYILTNKKAIRGAGSLLNRELIKEFANKHEVKKVLILPSSIHEILLVPIEENEKINLDEISMIVREINRECVDEKEILSNEAYIFNV